jgi:hypothetical protein
MACAAARLTIDFAPEEVEVALATFGRPFHRQPVSPSRPLPRNPSAST